MECFISEQLLMVYVTWLSELGDIDHYTALKWYPGDMSCRNGLLDMDQHLDLQGREVWTQ